MEATLSINGIYEYDNTIFDRLILPDNLEEFRSDIINTVLFDTLEYGCLYTEPTFLKSAIGVFSKKNAPVWGELYETTQYEYNPIWNKDGTIEEIEKENTTDTHDLSNLETRNLNNTETRDLNNTETRNLNNLETRDLETTTKITSNTTSNETGNQKEYVFGYNSESKAGKSEIDTTKNVTNNTTNNGTGTDTGTVKNDETGTVKNDNTGTVKNDNTGTVKNEDTGTLKRDRGREYKRIEQGNIGITTTQQMINEQREVVLFNIFDYIANDFKKRFCIMASI